MMRHSILKSIIVAALLSVAQMTVAVEDIYIEETVNGQISYAVSGSVVTLTVTPATDYYITADDIVVQKTIDGGAVSSQRVAGPKVADKLPLTPVDVDDTGKGTYSFNLVEGYGAYVTATFTECLSISPSVEISDWIYGDTPSAPTVLGNTGNGDVAYYYKNVQTEGYSPEVPVNAGEYLIFAAIAAKGHYKSAETTEVSFSIKKAPLKITAKDYTIKQGEALPTFEATYEGFKNDETETVLTTKPTYTTTATSTGEPGDYDIIVSGAEAQNYDITYVAGKLTIVEKVEIMPITETEEISFKEIIAGETNLENTVIDNTYYNVDATNGDGYDTTEQALVLNSTTTDEQMNTIQDAEVGDAVVHENYTGIIFEIPESKGSVTVDVQTIGTHVLMVQIGNSVPTKITKMERGTVDVPFDVKEPSYVYLYASTENGSAARLDRAPVVGENSVLLYGYKVTFGASYIPGDANGDGNVNVTDIVEIVSYIMGKPSNRFVFTAADVTGDGDVNVTDIVSVVNIIMSNPSREIDEISL